jgi:hypothetical protein
MRLYFSPHNLCKPVCKQCAETIERHGLIDAAGNYWHPTCYEQFYIDLIAVIKDDLIHIATCTADHNSGAYATATAALNKLNQI